MFHHLKVLEVETNAAVVLLLLATTRTKSVKHRAP